MNIIITGASKGMGRAIARLLATKGVNLALCSRNYNELSVLKAELLANYPATNVFIQSVDCADKQAVISFAEDSLAQFGYIDVLINNVGIFKPANILDEDDDALQNHMNINLYAPYYLYKKIGKSMKERKSGTIINICSIASKEIIVGAGSYCVTKAALLSLNNIMREELKAHDVKVTAILPGSTLTSSWEGTTIPPQEFVQEEDIAEAVNTVLTLSKGANIDEIIIKPLHGQV
ncbi:short-chain dehydrogenase/reductase SDR [Pseudopedobacter saltans DSM 12145]|uniref:Short-chain dehydrogenase/reductase SDR n=1 Tax=Pseudopedobacter saltans (strain ATCC 51119 / DSM 12145 / JCM 21818 / CCUG 39354 / LMG 10337 / NBRC 100064 / NCIMB 13643) TaxID=762903 RepID=F0SCF8_PSESL|nr:SDR family oxidoreductase [Pseudopedobacter saltans]ADY52792.1 short-chain dehydrogenase/reductase SDR [Pseudopedobacter saltans DSM 12145]